MNLQQTNPQQKQRALLVLPLLLIPFLTMAFWALEGGKGTRVGTNEKSGGLNFRLPDAQLREEENKTKLGFYESQAKTESRTSDSLMDSFLQKKAMPAVAAGSADGSAYAYDPSPLGSSLTNDSNEAKVYRQLDELNNVLAAQVSTEKKEKKREDQRKVAPVEAEDADRLADMLERVQEKKEPDPELEQLNGMMERILDIQHPERVKDKLKEQSLENKRHVYAVSSHKEEVETSLLGSSGKGGNMETHNAFFGKESQPAEQQTEANAIASAVQGDAVITAGSTVKLRLLTDVFIGGSLIPKGTFVFGTATIEEERLKIFIPAVRYRESLFPVSLHVYDMDGLEGIHVPGSVSRDAGKGSAEQSLQSIGLLSLDPSLKGQATAAGIQAARGLLSKKVRGVRVMLKAGYRVLLKDGNQQQ